VNGVDSGYQRFIDDGIEELLPGLSDLAAQHFSITDMTVIEGFRSILRAEASTLIDKMSKKREEDFTQQFYNTVEMLDKPELAVLAESLVGLVALKQKISLDLESVGGPIDVAIISKHDGFIWIKRKHYFSREYNPAFVENYLKFARAHPTVDPTHGPGGTQGDLT
jgi:hypothetical protein